jgi:hypothetical protein
MRILLLTGLLYVGLSSLFGQEAAKQKNESKLHGTWTLVSMKYGEAKKFTGLHPTFRMVKHITGTHYCWVQSEKATGKVSRMTGGQCAITETKYIESVKYFMGKDTEWLLNKRVEHSWKVDGNKLHSSFSINGSKYEEIWERAK